jgi:uroporphyrinogen decarboxylase
MKALNHEESDRVPIDLNGTYASGILTQAYEPLKAYLDIGGVTEEMAGRSATAVVEEEVLRRFQVDTRKVVVRIPDLRMQRNPDGTQTDQWGVTWGKPEDGNWYVTHSPLEGEPTVADIERYPFPDPDEKAILDGLYDEVSRLHHDTDFAVCLNLPSRLVHQIQFLRGYAESLMDLLVNRPFIEALMDRITEINVRIARNVLALVGDMVDVICIGDDLGTQSGPVMSLETYRDLIKPRQQRLLDTIKTHTQAHVWYHSCGSVSAFLPDLIEIGVDALNPVQVSAKDMDPQTLKREFGKDLTFWGGIDTQQVLPFGTPEEVAAEVRRRFAELGPGGGWVCAAVHNIQPGVPPENICALFDTALECGRYN